MSGYELAQLWRGTPAHRDVQLVAMTGYGRAEDRQAAPSAGFDAHLTKPADLKELRGLLGNGRGASSD